MNLLGCFKLIVVIRKKNIKLREFIQAYKISFKLCKAS